MGYNNNSGNSFGNQPSLKDLVLGQTKINDSINKRKWIALILPLRIN
jgi:hypothetical protein